MIRTDTGGGADILPVIQVSISLYGLRRKVDRVAGKEEVVLGRHGEGVAHECCGVDDEGAGHGAGNAVWFPSALSRGRSTGRELAEKRRIIDDREKGVSHLRVFLNVHHGGDGDTEIRGWAPKIWKRRESA